MDLNTLLTGVAGHMSSALLSARVSASVGSKALASQRQTGEAVLELLESSRPDPAYQAQATGKGTRIHVVA